MNTIANETNQTLAAMDWPPYGVDKTKGTEQAKQTNKKKKNSSKIVKTMQEKSKAVNKPKLTLHIVYRNFSFVKYAFIKPGKVIANAKWAKVQWLLSLFET